MLTLFLYVHMLTTITGMVTIVKNYSLTGCSFKLLPSKYNIVIFRTACRSCTCAIVKQSRMMKEGFWWDTVFPVPKHSKGDVFGSH
jgi:hypothetical protein